MQQEVYGLWILGLLVGPQRVYFFFLPPHCCLTFVFYPSPAFSFGPSPWTKRLTSLFLSVKLQQKNISILIAVWIIWNHSVPVCNNQDGRTCELVYSCTLWNASHLSLSSTVLMVVNPVWQCREHIYSSSYSRLFSALVHCLKGFRL